MIVIGGYEIDLVEDDDSCCEWKDGKADLSLLLNFFAFEMNYQLLIENFVNNRDETSVQQLGQCMLKKIDLFSVENCLLYFSVD